MKFPAEKNLGINLKNQEKFRKNSRNLCLRTDKTTAEQNAMNLHIFVKWYKW